MGQMSFFQVSLEILLWCLLRCPWHATYHFRTFSPTITMEVSTFHFRTTMGIIGNRLFYFLTKQRKNTPIKHSSSKINVLQFLCCVCMDLCIYAPLLEPTPFELVSLNLNQGVYIYILLWSSQNTFLLFEKCNYCLSYAPFSLFTLFFISRLWTYQIRQPMHQIKAMNYNNNKRLCIVWMYSPNCDIIKWNQICHITHKSKFWPV